VNDGDGFADVLGALVPLGLVGAFSWLPVAGVVALLLAPEGRAKVPAFVAGRVSGLAAVTVAFVAGARALPPVPHLDGPVVAGAEVLAGVALVLVGLFSWHGRHQPRDHAAPVWLTRLGEASTTAVFTTSVLVDLQPKGLVLGLAAGAVVRGGSMPVPEAVSAVLIYLALAASSVFLPVVAAAVAPARTERWLRASERWLTAHGSVLTAAVAASVGGVLVANAVGRF
jgi:Sap-like sulfolipid-1-addressing protein